MSEKLSNGQRTAITPEAKLSQGIVANTDLAKCGAGLSRGPNRSAKNPNAAWTQTWPAPGATLDLDFANDRGFVRGVGNGKSMDAVTFTRASSGNWVDSTGTLRTGNGTFTGSANATGVNLLSNPQNFENALWNRTGILNPTSYIASPDSTNTAQLIAVDNSSGNHNINQSVSSTTGTFSIYVKAGYYTNIVLIDNSSGTGCGFNLVNGATSAKWGVTLSSSYGSISVGNGWWRCYISVTNTTNVRVYVDDGVTSNANFIGIPGQGVFIWGAQLELGSSATAYYPTNINTPRFDWASTASTGAGTAANPYVIPLQANPTCNGLLIEESRTNRALWCRDATQTGSWTATNVTTAKNQTGIDGVSNAASSLTASSSNGTCIQTVTLASGSRTSSIYLKRLTGTGTIQVTLDGSTWSTVDLSNGLWNRIVLSGTVTNPCIGVLIATSGDSVAMDFAQIEDGLFATTPILTTSATVTRSQDAANISTSVFSGLGLASAGTLYAAGRTPPFTSNTANAPYIGAIAISGTINYGVGYGFTNNNGNNSLSYSYNYTSNVPSAGNNANVYSACVYNNISSNSGKGALNGKVYFPNVTQPIGQQYFNTIFIGGLNADSRYFWNSTIRRIWASPTKLSEAGLIDATSQDI